MSPCGRIQQLHRELDLPLSSLSLLKLSPVRSRAVEDAVSHEDTATRLGHISRHYHVSIFFRQKTPPFRAGDEWRSGSPCGRLSAVPQGLRECTLVERGRYPSPHGSCQPVTAFHLRVSLSGPL